MADVYAVDVVVYATAYIKAPTPEDALSIARTLKGRALEVVENDLVCGLDFDDHRLPALSLSPAMTIYGPEPSEVPTLASGGEG